MSVLGDGTGSGTEIRTAPTGDNLGVFPLGDYFRLPERENLLKRGIFVAPTLLISP
jgi:hypothetical protein